MQSKTGFVLDWLCELEPQLVQFRHRVGLFMKVTYQTNTHDGQEMFELCDFWFNDGLAIAVAAGVNGDSEEEGQRVYPPECWRVTLYRYDRQVDGTVDVLISDEQAARVYAFVKELRSEWVRMRVKMKEEIERDVKDKEKEFPCSRMRRMIDEKHRNAAAVEYSKWKEARKRRITDEVFNRMWDWKNGVQDKN